MAERTEPDDGFDVRKVTWAYREMVRDGLALLRDRGLLGAGNEAATRTFFFLLDTLCDHGDGYMVKSVMAAVTGPHGWLLRVPSLFNEWVRLGRMFSDRAFYMGNGYFTFWSGCDAVDGPAAARKVLAHTAFIADTGLHGMRIAEERDALVDLAYAFLTNYPVIDRYCPRRHEKDELIRTALVIHSRNRAGAHDFFKLRTQTSLTYVRRITADVRLEEVEPLLNQVMTALAGKRLPVAGLGDLDADYLLESGSYLVAGRDGVFFPHHFAIFDEHALNREYAIVCAMLAAVDFRHQGFTRYHGQPGAETAAAFLRDIVSTGISTAAVIMFQTAEVIRILSMVRERYPGLYRRFCRIHTALGERIMPELSPGERLITAWINGDTAGKDDTLLRHAAGLAEKSGGAKTTAGEAVRLTAAGMDGWTAGEGLPLRWFPDFNYPIQPESPGLDAGPVTEGAAGSEGDEEGRGSAASSIPGVGTPGLTGNWRPSGAEFLYDEWDFIRKDYYADWCRLYEMQCAGDRRPAHDRRIFAWQEQAGKIRRWFECMAPEAMGPEKHRETGDDINTEHLVEYLCDRRTDPGCRPAFYEKRVKRRRDVAVAVLLDASASTNNVVHAGKSVLEVEKEAAFALCEGLAPTGDLFALSAFSGTGRQQVRFFRIKDFDTAWDDDARHRLAALPAVSSTRIGPAVRHAGALLARQPSRTKILIIITDGEPADSEYEHRNKYAQHDVRRAVEELRTHDVHCFCVGTRVDDPADMELMFPGSRYVIIRKVRDLLGQLPGIYMRLAG